MPDHGERRLGIAVAEPDEMLRVLAPDPHFHPFGKRVDDRGADAVQPAGDLVGILVELAAGVQARQDHFRRRDALLRVQIGRDSAPVVAHGDAAVAVQGHVHPCRKSGLCLVDRVVDDLEDHVVEA